MIRVLSYPDRHRNPYFQLFYGALKPYGVEVAYTDDIADHLSSGPERAFDVLHLHWNLHHLWRRPNRGHLGQAAALVEWWKFLRLTRRAGIRIVWTAHELFPRERKRWFDLLGYAVCGHAADLCICHSSHARTVLTRRYFVPASRTITIPIGTYFGAVPDPAGRTATNQRFGVPAGSRLLACFGDLRPGKGFQTVIQAAPLLGNDYEIVIAGEAPNASCQRWVHTLQGTLHTTPNVRLLNERLEDQALADLVGCADCVLLPYVEIFASSALSLCLALGRAVVASDLPYFREVLSLEPDAAVLVKPGDPIALAQAVHEFFAKPLEVRHEAAKRLGSRLAWDKLLPPVAAWLAAHVACSRPAPGR